MGLFGRKVAGSTQSFTAIVAKMRQDYEVGRYQKVYATRDHYGYNIGEKDMPREEWFWFNALGALAGLKLGMTLGGYLSGYCGMADQSTDWDNPKEKAAKDEIERLAFPK